MHDYRINEICARYQQGQTKDYEDIVDMVERGKTVAYIGLFLYSDGGVFYETAI